MNSFALSLRTIRLRQFNICYATEAILIVETGFILFQSGPPIHHPGRVEVCELNHYALESKEQAEKLKRMAAWQVRSTAIQARERTAMGSVQVSAIHTVRKVIGGQDITSITIPENYGSWVQ